jgi:hypothetical protein
MNKDAVIFVDLKNEVEFEFINISEAEVVA